MVNLSEKLKVLWFFFGLFGSLFQELELNIGPFWCLERFSSRLCRQLFLHCRLNESLNKGVPLEPGLKFGFWGTSLCQCPCQILLHTAKSSKGTECVSLPLVDGLESRNAHMWQIYCWLVLWISLAHLAASPSPALESDFHSVFWIKQKEVEECLEMLKLCVICWGACVPD